MKCSALKPFSPYHEVVFSLASRYCALGKTLLDVGGGITLGRDYLKWFDSFSERVSVELQGSCFGNTVKGVNVIIEDFLKFSPNKRYDLVLCLQVLEHVKEPTTFAQKLFESGKVIIISVPHLWPEGSQPTHIHNLIDRRKLESWTCQLPVESLITNHRLIHVYCKLESTCVC